MIDPKSESYPVHGAARAAGVDLEFAYGWLEASRQPAALRLEPAATARVEAIWLAGCARHGEAAMCELASRLIEAWIDGRLKVQLRSQ